MEVIHLENRGATRSCLAVFFVFRVLMGSQGVLPKNDRVGLVIDRVENTVGFANWTGRSADTKIRKVGIILSL